MDQAQILEAPAVVIFSGDRRVFHENFEEMLHMERVAGTISSEYERKLRKFVPLAFSHGPAGLGWFWKALLAPLLRPLVRIPEIPVVHKRIWLCKQTMLAAMNFVLAATTAGLATVPMEGFDAGRLRRVIRAPRRYELFLVVPVGYPGEQKLHKTRLPLDRIVHRVENAGS